eukprot:10027533-Prorocentrum_lima.AAC.1
MASTRRRGGRDHGLQRQRLGTVPGKKTEYDGGVAQSGRLRSRSRLQDAASDLAQFGGVGVLCGGGCYGC